MRNNAPSPEANADDEVKVGQPGRRARQILYVRRGVDETTGSPRRPVRSALEPVERQQRHRESRPFIGRAALDLVSRRRGFACSDNVRDRAVYVHQRVGRIGRTWDWRRKPRRRPEPRRSARLRLKLSFAFGRSLLSLIPGWECKSTSRFALGSLRFRLRRNSHCHCGDSLVARRRMRDRRERWGRERRLSARAKIHRPELILCMAQGQRRGLRHQRFRRSQSATRLPKAAEPDNLASAGTDAV